MATIRYADSPPWADNRTDEAGEVQPEHRRWTQADPDPKTLNPWRRERREQHRALLLLAMQDPNCNLAHGPAGKGVCDGRSLNAVARTLSGERSRSAVVSSFRRNAWADRIAAHGDGAQRYAVRLYRHLYYQEHGRGDMEVLAPYVSVPVSNHKPRRGEDSTEVQERAVEMLRRLLNGGDLTEESFLPDDVADPVREAWEQRRARGRETNAALRNTALHAIRAIQQSVKMTVDEKFAADPKNAHIRPAAVKVADLPRLVSMLRDLEDEEARLLGLPTASNAQRLPDTARVAIAKEHGQPVLPAILEDLAEATTLCRQLIAREPLDLAALQLAQNEDTAPATDGAAEA